MQAAVAIFMGTLHLGAVFVAADVCQHIQQGIFKIWGEVYSKITGGVMDDAIRWTPPIGLLDQQAVDCHLEDVRVIGHLWRPTGLDLDRNDNVLLPDEVIRLAGEAQVRIVQRFFNRPPEARIGVDDSSARETGVAALAPRDEKQGQGEQEESKA